MGTAAALRSRSGSSVTLTPVMPRIEYIPTRNGDGTISLRAVVVGPLERLRRLVRRVLNGA